MHRFPSINSIRFSQPRHNQTACSYGLPNKFRSSLFFLSCNGSSTVVCTKCMMQAINNDYRFKKALLSICIWCTLCSSCIVLAVVISFSSHLSPVLDLICKYCAILSCLSLEIQPLALYLCHLF